MIVYGGCCICGGSLTTTHRCPPDVYNAFEKDILDAIDNMTDADIDAMKKSIQKIKGRD